MNVHKFNLGDLVAKKNGATVIKKGIVVQEREDSFVVKWTHYDKNFFMEKEGDIFEDLNKIYLLSFQSFHRNNNDAFLSLLSAS